MNGNNTPLSEMLGISMDKVKEMADVNSIIGEPIKLDNGVTIIPISKVSYGFGGGGSDIPSKYDKNLFGGGAGAGVTIKPEGFLVVSADGNVKMVRMEDNSGALGTVIDKAPDVVSMVTGFIKKKKGDSEETEE